jgi:hypothetical protein
VINILDISNMHTRTLTFTGYKLGTNNAEITVSFDGETVFSGSVTNDSLGTIFTHTIPVTSVDLADFSNPGSANIIPIITSSHTVRVTCTQGSIALETVTSPALNETDNFSVIPDPLWFVETYSIIHGQEHDRTAPLPPAPREATVDPKYHVTLDGSAVNNQVTSNDNGLYTQTIPTNSTLEFKIMIRNLIAFKEPAFIPPMVLWQQLEKPLRGETYGDQ